MTADDTERLEKAGDYVLGLLSEAERLGVERDMLGDPLLRAAVDRLSSQLHVLDDMPADAVQPALWDRIAAQIETAGQEPATTSADVVRLSERQAARPPVWRPLAMAASVVLALGLGYLAGSMSSEPGPVVVVVLDKPDSEPGAIFEAYADNRVRIVPLEDFVVPEGQIMQVWTLYDQAVGPVSLGTLPRAESAVVKGEGLPVPTAEQLYEITLEPAPGSPTGKPTGPILVKGFAKRPAG